MSVRLVEPEFAVVDLRRHLSGRTVRVLTPGDAMIFIADDGDEFPVIYDENSARWLDYDRFQVRLGFYLPIAILILVDAKKVARKRKKARTAYLILPELSEFVAMIGEAGLFGVSPDGERAKLFPVGDPTTLLIGHRLLSTLGPPADLQARAVDVLRLSFPEAEWLADYLSRRGRRPAGLDGAARPGRPKLDWEVESGGIDYVW